MLGIGASDGFRDLSRGKFQREHRVVGMRADVADGLELERGDRAIVRGAYLAVVDAPAGGYRGNCRAGCA